MSGQSGGQSGSATGDSTTLSPEAQYRECYEYFRQVLRFIWQVPAVAVVVDGALVASAFALGAHWIVRELVLAIAFLLTAALTFAVFKFRYFAIIGQETLTRIEKCHAEKVIQRTSRPKNGCTYWFRSEGSGAAKLSSDWILITGMCFILGLLILLMILNATVLKTWPPIDLIRGGL